jgi:hypothetical protein
VPSFTIKILQKMRETPVSLANDPANGYDQCNKYA